MSWGEVLGISLGIFVVIGGIVAAVMQVPTMIDYTKEMLSGKQNAPRPETRHQDRKPHK